MVGEISHYVKKNLSLNTFTSGFELNLEDILKIGNRNKQVLSDSKYPYLTQDISFSVPEKITYKELYNKVEKSLENKDLRSEIECIDIYKEEENDKRKVTLRTSISNTKKTLNEKDMKEIRKKIEKNIKKLNISM